MAAAAIATAAPALAQDINDFVPPEVEAAVNAATGAVVSAVSRPTSPFVSGLATDVAPDTCGGGLWTRGNGTMVSSTGTPQIDVRYGSAMVAADFSCFNVKGSGVDVTGGVEVGTLVGAGYDTATPSATVDLTQYFGGVYVAVAKAPFAADAEYRREMNTFTVNIPGLVIPQGTEIVVNRNIVNFAASYSIDLGNDLFLVPAAGGSVINTEQATITTPIGTATIANSTGVIAFVGATLAKVIILDDQASAIRPFATATWYQDFGTDLTVNVVSPALPGGGGVATLAGPGGYGEISLGLEYVKLLEGDGPRQFTGSARADARFGQDFWGLAGTIQGRIQF